MSDVPGGEVLVYETPDGGVRVDVRLERETVWLTQQQMAELFGRERSVVTKHIRNAFQEGELDAKATCARFAEVRSEGGWTVSRGVDGGKHGERVEEDRRWTAWREGRGSRSAILESCSIE